MFWNRVLRKVSPSRTADHRRRISLCCFTMSLCLFAAGCRVGSYLRLLSLKEQLGDFDRFVSFRRSDGLMAFEFKKPVLYDEDVLFLIFAPTMKEEPGEKGGPLRGPIDGEA